MEKRKEVLLYTSKNGECYIENWLNSLDSTTRARILLRLSRIEYGNYGDHKYLNDNIFELRFFFGGGYRIYFIEEGNYLVLLLNGGDKKTQVRDIKKAKKLLKQYKEGDYEKTKRL